MYLGDYIDYIYKKYGKTILWFWWGPAWKVNMMA